MMSNSLRRFRIRRATLAMLIAIGLSGAAALSSAHHRRLWATARLASAGELLDSLTDFNAADNPRRTAIAWGYAERLRLGLESPFRLVESAARDPRLTDGERRLVSWALLSRILRGETHEVEAAALDGIIYGFDGPVGGERHLEIIGQAIAHADNPRAAELGVRLAYSLAAAERIVTPAAPLLATEAAAMLADRELARREAAQVVRAANGRDPISVVVRRRDQRAFYVERPVLLTPTPEIERVAILLADALLDSLRQLRAEPDRRGDAGIDDNVLALAPRLFAAGAFALPSAPLTVTVRRHLPMIEARAPRLDHAALARTFNAEMLVAVTRLQEPSRSERHVIGRMLLAAAVSMRSRAQEPVWFPGDSAASATEVVARHGLAEIAFDRAVPTPWRGYYLNSFDRSIADIKRVLPALTLNGLRVRFRMDAPADSALAMHDPRTRTLHLPVISVGGTLTHELAHDLDRQSAQRLGRAGYRSDIVARGTTGRLDAENRLAASLRALTDGSGESPGTGAGERPAEIFATRVDWFVAEALARVGRTNGFLSAAQDEILTGHVVHPHRLRSADRSRPLLTALEELTSVASFAAREQEPSLMALLRWSLGATVDRREGAEILRGRSLAWSLPSLSGHVACGVPRGSRAHLVRLAADSRARGWLRVRARWSSDSTRSAWARATLGHAPWSEALADARREGLRHLILSTLASEAPDLAIGFAAHATPHAEMALCGSAE